MIWIAIGIAMMVLSGCDPTENAQSFEQRPAGKPSDYFPTRVGTKWVYAIKIGEMEPIHYRETSWPLGETRVAYATRGRFMPLLDDRPKKDFILAISVKSLASKQGPLEYPSGVELEIEQDELGIFESAKQVFWAISPGRFMAHEVITYSPDTPGAPIGGLWGGWGQEDGYSMRLVFFADKPGIQIGLGREPVDTLLFDGIDTQVPSYEGTPCLHFVRQVEPSKPNDEERLMDSRKIAFTEHIWFARNKGLVRLEQRREGIAMVWKLVQFHEGR
jgi:hypothetical protein